ncbi:ribonuclease P [Candidatus Woesearchaeota archaeon]|nr:ribonuclease P [Candidatus Woesearchaeota archaeon]
MRSKNQQKKIALVRIKLLFNQAEEVFPMSKVLANRYVQLAQNISMKVKVRIPKELKRRFCKHCYAYLTPGVNARVRTRGGKVIISCLDCKKFMRIPIR